MTLQLDAAIAASGINVVLLVGLLAVWVRSYREVGATHTLGLIVFASFLVVENLLWLYFYAIDSTYRSWFVAISAESQWGLFMLCGFELVALLVLAKITWA